MLTRFLKKLGKSALPFGPYGQHMASETDADTLCVGSEGLGAGGGVMPNWQPGDVILGRYRVEQIMHGAMGNIYIATHLGWGVKMAIKAPRPEVLRDPEGVQRIIAEANAWVEISMHPNIAYCYYVLSLHDIPHLFIEYVDGGSLDDWIKRGRCSDLRTILSLAIQFCHGMEYTHAHGIVHRDIKPQNILITTDTLLKITDFGILRMSSQAVLEGQGGIPKEEDPHGNITVGFRGTPGYASPEQWQNSHAVDKRTDIYSFGLCLWMMICGKKPFKHNAERSPIPEPTPASAGMIISDDLARILKKCVAYDPDERFSDFVSLREDLNAVYQDCFHVPCPYNTLEGVDLRADGLNNRGVSLFELGRIKEAEECLNQALEIDDSLPEAIHNLILFKIRTGKMRPEQAVHHIVAMKKRWGKRSKVLVELETAIRKLEPAAAQNLDGAQEDDLPEFRLCVPVKTVDVYRQGQLLRSVKRSVDDHILRGRYAEGHAALLTAWANEGFRKDEDFTRAYVRLLKMGSPKKVAGVQRLRTMSGHAREVVGLAFTKEGREMVSLSVDGQILVRRFSPSLITTRLETKGMVVQTFAISPQGKRMVTGAVDGGIAVWSLESEKLLGSSRVHEGPVVSVAFSHDGRLLASGGEDGFLRIRDFNAGKEKKIAVHEGGAILSLTFLPKSNEFVTGSVDGALRFWDASRGECVRIINAHVLPVVSLSVSQDGKFVTSGSRDRAARVWDSHTGLCVKSLEGHEDGVAAVLMLADNMHVVTGCEDDTVKIWHVQSGECLQTVDARGDGVYSLAIGPQPHMFASGRHDGGTVFWLLICHLDFDSRSGRGRQSWAEIDVGMD